MLVARKEGEPVEDIKRFTLRLPPALHSQLESLAEQDRRSLHAEILVLLEEAIVAREGTRGDVQEPGGKVAA